MTRCFYDQADCSSVITREHLISKGVLKVAFGDPVKNVVSSDVVLGKFLLDQQSVVRDICSRCNNSALSQYDEAGVELARVILGCSDPADLQVPLSREIFGWLFKTHLNHMRVIKDRESGVIYPIHPDLKRSLIEGEELNPALFSFLVEGWQEPGYFWDAEDDRRIPWFNYTSIKFRKQRIVLSNFRIKNLSTTLLVPDDAGYDDFQARAKSALNEARSAYGFDPEQIDVRNAISEGGFVLGRVLPVERVMQFIRRV